MREYVHSAAWYNRDKARQIISEFCEKDIADLIPKKRVSEYEAILGANLRECRESLGTGHVFSEEDLAFHPIDDL